MVVVGCANVAVGQGAAVDVRIASGEPLTWDPAKAGDSGSANVLAQVFEGLTAFDADSNVQPALADSWQASDDGRQITFHLRPGIAYSDGTPITSQDVVDSWLRLIDPQIAVAAGQPAQRRGRRNRLSAGCGGRRRRRPARRWRPGRGRPATAGDVLPLRDRLAVARGRAAVDVRPARRAAARPSNIVVSGAYVPIATVSRT